MHERISYFPAYELVMKELRDYRYYKEDMLHPSSLAIDFIWEKFQQSFMDSPTIETVEQIEKVSRIFDHKGTIEEDVTQKSERKISDLVESAKMRQ
jgi:hypothetical protein